MDNQVRKMFKPDLKKKDLNMAYFKAKQRNFL